MKVLVVDDSRSIRLLVGLALRGAGHLVVEAGSGEAALHELAKGPVDCVLCDVNMPGLDGLELLERLRALPGHRRTPVVMLTTETGVEALRRGSAAGVRGWIVKPFTRDQLVGAVETAALPAPGGRER